MADNTETYIIKLKDGNFISGMKAAGKQTDKLKSKVERTRSSVGGLQKAFAGLLAAGVVTRGISKSLTAFDAQEKALAQVRQGLRSTGGVAGRTFDELTKKASELQKKTLFGDEQILQEATAQLLTFTSIAGEQFDRAQVSALNLATRLNGDLKSASLQLGKALNDPVKGMSALSRSGITFSNEQIEVIKHLQKTNRLAEAQGLILDELDKQYGGSSEAAAKAGTGGLKQLGNVLGDLQEKFGALLYDGIRPSLPFFFKLTDSASKLFDIIRENKETLSAVIGIIAGAAAPFAAIVLVTKLWTIAQWALNLAMTANPIGIVVAAIGALVAGIVIAWKRSEKFRAVIKGLWATLKQLGENIKTNFIEIPKLVIEAFQKVPSAILHAFKSIGGIIKAVLTGDFKAVPDLLKKAFNENPVVGVGKKAIQLQIDNAKKLGKAYGDAYDKEISESRLKNAIKGSSEALEASRMAMNGYVNSKGGGSLGGDKGSGSGLGAGIAGVKASAPKTFNINIDSLIKEQNISTTNLNESSQKIKEAVTRALLTAVNDSQIISE